MLCKEQFQNDFLQQKIKYVSMDIIQHLLLNSRCCIRWRVIDVHEQTDPSFPRADGREVKHFHKYQNYKSYEKDKRK